MEGKIYINQVLQIVLDTKQNLSTAVDPKIRAIKPDGTVVEWSATVSGSTLIYLTQLDQDLDQAGVWRVQAVPKLSGQEAPGETAKFTVHSLGQ